MDKVSVIQSQEATKYHIQSVEKTDSLWQGGLNQKKIQLNPCNIFSILICNELYLFA